MNYWRLPIFLASTFLFTKVAQAQITNPIDPSSIEGVAGVAIDILFPFATIVAVIYLIIGGYSYITAAGNPEAQEAAKKSIINAIIGLLLVLASYLIIQFILTQLGAFGSDQNEGLGNGNGGGNGPTGPGETEEVEQITCSGQCREWALDPSADFEISDSRCANDSPGSDWKKVYANQNSGWHENLEECSSGQWCWCKIEPKNSEQEDSETGASCSGQCQEYGSSSFYEELMGEKKNPSSSRCAGGKPEGEGWIEVWTKKSGRTPTAENHELYCGESGVKCYCEF